MTRKLKKTCMRIGIGVIFFIIALVAPLEGWWKIGLFVIPYLIIGGDVLYRAVRNILRGQVFDENFLMCIATIGAFLVGEYPESVAVMLFYQVGEAFQSYAVNRSRKSISALMDIRPDYANVLRNGEVVTVFPEEVEIDEIIVVKPGEKIPLDGVVTKGSSMIDTSALTGESVPRSIRVGKDALSGCINQSGVVEIRVTKEFAQSTVSKILDLVENASGKKAKAENFITKFAKYYTPVVVFLAMALAVLPPLILGVEFLPWIQRALIFLVISCPCALVISIPLSFFAGIGGASKCGILVKGSNYLEALSNVETVVFDKTGTLTNGSFKVTQVVPEGVSKEELLEIAAVAESGSNHPISISLRNAYAELIDESRVSNQEEIAGHGIRVTVDGRAVLIGNSKLMRVSNIKSMDTSVVGTIVHVSVDSVYWGYIVISDEIKPDSRDAIQGLNKMKGCRTVLLTGDKKEVADEVARELGIQVVYSELLPGDKVDKLEELIAQKSPKGKVVFVGDGINDAPVLTRADIGIAMGGLGSDAAIEAADIVIMDDMPSKILKAVQIANRTLSIVKQNIVFALGVKVFFLILGAFGIANMWEAVFADVGVSVLAILNAMYAMRIK